ncbi:hypothetical protein SBDP1_700016 [Syntrophobacter sp. SbD1]|nr:hypothetical protein SBDP1_700016 [Syntrophobacter sp. SbD1]
MKYIFAFEITPPRNYLLSYKRLKEKGKTLQNPPEECSVRNYLIDPYQIHYLRFIVEAYPGMAVVSTIDSTLGLVSISIAPGCEQDILRILEAERNRLNLSEADLKISSQCV